MHLSNIDTGVLMVLAGSLLYVSLRLLALKRNQTANVAASL
jgi:hypothetical protein